MSYLNMDNKDLKKARKIAKQQLKNAKTKLERNLAKAAIISIKEEKMRRADVLAEAKDKLKALANVVNEDAQAFIGPMPKAPTIKSITATGKPSIYTQEERDIFNARIENEKKNILRICASNPQNVLLFCQANVADEKNAAVRFAREAAMKWAVRMIPPVSAVPAPVVLPF